MILLKPTAIIKSLYDWWRIEILYDGEMMATIANTNIKNANIKGFEVKLNQKLGFVATVDDARQSLERIYNDNIKES